MSLYIQIRDDIADQIIKHGLSKTESKLFFYLLKLDRFGDRPVKVKVAEILLATGIGKTAYHAALAKFEALGWFDFKHSDVEVRNLSSPQNSSEKRTSSSEFRKNEPESRTSESEKRTENSEKRTEAPPKPLPAKDSATPHTIQTYSDFIHTLSEETREKFLNFCNGKIEKANFAIASKKAWLNAHHQEYWEEFKKLTKPYISPQSPKCLAEVRSLFKSAWQDAALHYGFSQSEIDEFSQNLCKENKA